MCIYLGYRFFKDRSEKKQAATNAAAYNDENYQPPAPVNNPPPNYPSQGTHQTLPPQSQPMTTYTPQQQRDQHP